MIVATSGAGTAFPSTTLGNSPLLVGFILLIFLSFFFKFWNLALVDVYHLSLSRKLQEIDEIC